MKFKQNITCGVLSLDANQQKRNNYAMHPAQQLYTLPSCVREVMLRCIIAWDVCNHCRCHVVRLSSSLPQHVVPLPTHHLHSKGALFSISVGIIIFTRQFTSAIKLQSCSCRRYRRLGCRHHNQIIAKLWRILCMALKYLLRLSQDLLSIRCAAALQPPPPAAIALVQHFFTFTCT